MLRLILPFFIFVSQSTLAITNIESQRLNNTSPGTKGNISFTLDGEVGESDEFTLGSAITLIRSYTKDEWIVLLDREYGIRINNPAEGRKILIDVNTIVDYIEANKK